MDGFTDDFTFFVGVAGGEAELLRASSAVALSVTRASGVLSSTSGTVVRLNGNASGCLCAVVR